MVHCGPVEVLIASILVHQRLYSCFWKGFVCVSGVVQIWLNLGGALCGQVCIGSVLEQSIVA